MDSLPFSARNRGAQGQIDNDFPSTARSGLDHLLVDLVDKRYVEGWWSLAKELQRIARLPPVEYNQSNTRSIQQARDEAETILGNIAWEKLYDFCERLHSHLARAVGEYWNNSFQEETSKAAVQVYITEELQRLFTEENLVFDFSDGLVIRKGRRHTVDKTTKAQMVLGDPRLASARKHYDKAMSFFRDATSPDYENCVKEAVCAVEAAGKALFPEAKASTLGDLVKWFASTKDVEMPKALIQTFTGLYGYRSGGNGVAHGAAEGGAATVDVAEYVLAVCASQIIYLVDLANGQENEIPF